MGVVIGFYLIARHRGVEAFIDITLLVAVAQQGILVGVEFPGNILFRLGELLGCHIEEKLLGSPGTDVLVCEIGAVLGRNAVGDVCLQLGQVKLVLADLGHDVPVVHEISDRTTGEKQHGNGADKYGSQHFHFNKLVTGKYRNNLCQTKIGGARSAP